MRERMLKCILSMTGFAFVLIFSLSPFVWMAAVSFSKSPDFLIREKFEFTLSNYKDILMLETLHFPDYLLNSFIITSATAVLSALIGGLAAYAVSRLSFKGKMLIIMSVLAFSMFPQISIVGYLYSLMSRLGWINTYRAIILPYVAWTLPLALWIMLSYFSQIPKEIDEAALVDGAGRFKILTKIILPLGMPGFLSTLLVVFLFAFNEFLFALMLTTDYRARPITVGIALFEGLHGQIPWGYIMAASIISSIPVIVIALFFQKRLIYGLTGGAVKE